MENGARRELTPRQRMRNEVMHLTALYGRTDERVKRARAALASATLTEQIRTAAPHLPAEDRRRLADVLLGAES